MFRRLIKIYIAIFLGFVVIFTLFLYNQKRAQVVADNEPVVLPVFVQSNLPVAKKVILGGVVPHHLLAENLIADFLIAAKKEIEPEVIVILSPDHFQRYLLNDNGGLLTVLPQTRELAGLAIDNDLLDSLPVDFIYNDSFVAEEHGIANLLPIIYQYFPQSKILPLIIPPDYPAVKVESLIDGLNQANKSIIVLASVDFSHYLPKAAADLHDAKSQRVLVNFEKEEFPRLEVDCWQCLYGARYFSQINNLAPQILAHKNSTDFLASQEADSTTSYFTIIFKQADNQSKQPNPNAQTFIFVGDVMLDRGVEQLMKKNSFYYPWQKMTRFLSGVDIAFANLEGPIVKDPPVLPDHSLTFAFSPEILPALNFNNINLVSLANNHTLNMRKEGLEQTREFLKQSNINFIGDPVKCTGEFAYENDKTVVLAFNQTFNYCADEDMAKIVSQSRVNNPAKFLIVSLHWGVEYQTINSIGQQKLGQKIIDSGADLIIGQHPHVAQNIELYKNKLIFYSLGNFIFDQYFSQATQEGLAVGLELNEDNLVFRLFPVLSKLSQPALMPASESGKFLTALASRSGKELQEPIKNGIIDLDTNLQIATDIQIVH